MKLTYSFFASSLEYPYLVCKIPISFSDCPFTVVRSSSVSFPHFALIPPFSSCHSALWPYPAIRGVSLQAPLEFPCQLWGPITHRQQLPLSNLRWRLSPLFYEH